MMQSSDVNDIQIDWQSTLVSQDSNHGGWPMQMEMKGGSMSHRLVVESRGSDHLMKKLRDPSDVESVVSWPLGSDATVSFSVLLSTTLGSALQVGDVCAFDEDRGALDLSGLYGCHDARLHQPTIG